jgi:preprotein translocase subunit SecE
MFRPVAPTGRAAVSKTACWGFESLLACFFLEDIMAKQNIFKKFISFVTSSYRELKKIDWNIVTKSVPEHLIGILIIIVFFSLFFLGCDSLIAKFISWVFGI